MPPWKSSELEMPLSQLISSWFLELVWSYQYRQWSSILCSQGQKLISYQYANAQNTSDGIMSYIEPDLSSRFNASYIYILSCYFLRGSSVLTIITINILWTFKLSNLVAHLNIVCSEGLLIEYGEQGPESHVWCLLIVFAWPLPGHTPLSSSGRKRRLLHSDNDECMSESLDIMTSNMGRTWHPPPSPTHYHWSWPPRSRSLRTRWFHSPGWPAPPAREGSPS